MKLINTDYINTYDKHLTHEFMHNSTIKKYVLGINKFSKNIQKYIQVDGIIDDFTRVQRSRKKTVLHINDVPKNSIILSTSSGSPLEVASKLDELGYTHFNYFSFYKYSNLELIAPDFLDDFEDDFTNNLKEYKKTYALLEDKESKDIFEKIINFKISFDLSFMKGFTNNFDEQYFDKKLISKIPNINFVDGGAYVGDSLPNIIKNFPDFKTIYCIEPNELHLNIAKREFAHIPNIQFIQSGLGEKKNIIKENIQKQNNCNHNYQTQNINSIDNLIDTKVDFIKLDIEGAEVDAIKGAHHCIKKHHPILAVCVYHKASHWYEIPQEVLQIRQDYEIYLRHYMESIYETVMYFIPKK